MTSPLTPEQHVAWALARTVRSRREDLHMSQDDVAFSAGINRSTIQCLENAVSDLKTRVPANPRLHTLFKLADALDLTIGELLKNVEKAYGGPHASIDIEIRRNK
ncbi:helix-turn-helix transcriptional regulator [Actinotignum urinale]|uniref:helix-turn-helix domain-containing protein n=1 Tax=Actinotignum urinale TaxID=190146 RepID=UPI002A7FB4F2|nr:helix-turn-helix transcriptional regulator [Actinotignum urinale]MDY5152325.1 helix-turn-helix transcriptional regulator [Actinotignum urinale]